MSILTQIVANGSGVCRANSGDLRKQSRKAGASIARWSFGITPCYAQSIIFKNSKLFEIRKERPTGYTRAVDAQAQDRECEERRDCSDCASTFGGMCCWRRFAVARVFALVVRCRVMIVISLFSRWQKP